MNGRALTGLAMVRERDRYEQRCISVTLEEEGSVRRKGGKVRRESEALVVDKSQGGFKDVISIVLISPNCNKVAKTTNYRFTITAVLL